MRKDCPTCERDFGADDIYERDGLTFIFGVGIEYRGRHLHLKRSEHRILRLLMKRRFVSFERLTEELCREETEAPRNSIKVMVSSLRKALKLIDAPFEVMNHPGLGYSLVKHVT